MLPASVASLALFAALLIPGMIYTVRLERYAARPQPSQLRELVRVILSSILCGVVAIAIYIPCRIGFSGAVPSVQSWAAGGNHYWISHFKAIATTCATYFAVTCLVALALAEIQGRAERGGRHLEWVARISKSFLPNPIRPRSSWSVIADLYEAEKDPPYVYVGCQMNDGSYVCGPLWTMNHKAEEDRDRDLVISAPILLRAAGSDRVVGLDTVHYSILSASDVSRIDVTHIHDPNDFPQPSPAARVEESAARGKTGWRNWIHRG